MTDKRTPQRAPVVLPVDKYYDIDAIRVDFAERKIDAAIPRQIKPSGVD